MGLYDSGVAAGLLAAKPALSEGSTPASELNARVTAHFGQSSVYES